MQDNSDVSGHQVLYRFGSVMSRVYTGTVQRIPIIARFSSVAGIISTGPFGFGSVILDNRSVRVGSGCNFHGSIWVRVHHFGPVKTSSAEPNCNSE